MAVIRWPWAVAALSSCAVLVLALQEFRAIVPTALGSCDEPMRGLSTARGQHLAVLVLGGVVLAASVVHAAVLAPSFFKAACSSCCGRSSLNPIQCAPRDAEAEVVRKECDKLLVQRARYLLHGLNCMMVPAGLWVGAAIVINVGKGAPMFGSGREGDEWSVWVFRDMGLPLSALICVALAGLSAKPELLTPRALDSFTLVFTCTWLWWVCSTSACNFCWLQARSLMARMLQVMFCSKKLLTSVTIVLAFIVDTAARVRHGITNAGTVNDATNDLVTAVVIIIFCWTIHQATLSEARALVESRRYFGANALVRRLLDSMCDAVVLLDAEFRVTQPSPRLSGLLLHGVLPQQRFTDLLHSDDRERFTEHVGREARQAQSEEAPPALPLHVKLRDANGSHVLVELFCSCIPDANTGVLQYLVGVKEEAPRYDEEVAKSNSDLVTTGPGVHCMRPENSSSLGSDDASDVSSLPDDTGEASVWVDPLDPDLHVQSYTPSFTALSGPLTVGTELASWFEHSHRFIASFQARANEWATDGCAGNFTFRDVTFTPRQLRLFGVRLEATIVLSLSTAEGEEESGWARLSFSNVRAKQRQSGRRLAGTPPAGAGRGHLRTNRPRPERVGRAQATQICRL